MPTRHTEYVKRSRYRYKRRCVEYLGDECADCHGKYHDAVYDFHHLDPSKKDFNVASGSTRNWDASKKELDKCVLLCANCHRIRHTDGERDLEYKMSMARQSFNCKVCGKTTSYGHTKCVEHSQFVWPSKEDFILILKENRLHSYTAIAKHFGCSDTSAKKFIKRTFGEAAGPQTCVS